MIKENLKRNLVTVAYTLTVTAVVWRWAIHMAYLERGYEAIGGEYFLIPVACWIAWKAINYLFDTLEDLKYE